jgi:hypothetical protein
MIMNARDSSALSSCVKQVSRTWKSTEASSLPRTVDGLKEAEDAPSAREREPTFAEFLAAPGEEVIALSEQRRSGSTEPILSRHEDGEREFAWPVSTSPNRKRQTIYASWTMRRGVGSDGRTAGDVV